MDNIQEEHHETLSNIFTDNEFRVLSDWLYADGYNEADRFDKDFDKWSKQELIAAVQQSGHFNALEKDFKVHSHTLIDKLEQLDDEMFPAFKDKVRENWNIQA